MLIQALFAVALTAQAQPLPRLVGTLSVKEGKVRIERTGRDPEWGSSYVRLRVGDKLTVVEKGRATVMLDAPREIWALPASGSFQVDVSGLKSIAGDLSPKLIRKIAAPKGMSGKPPSALAGVVRGADPQVFPFGAVLRNPVEMTWTKASGATRTTVEVFDTKGKSLWKQTVASGTKQVLPAKYTMPGSWVRVQVLQSGRAPVSSTAWLCVMTPEQVSTVEADEKALRAALVDDPMAMGMALGTLWAEHRMASRLAEAVKAALGDEVTAESCWQHGQWLELAGFPAEARGAYERAWDLGGRETELKDAILRLGGKAELEEYEKLAAEWNQLITRRNFAEALPLAERVIVLLRAKGSVTIDLADALFSKCSIHMALNQLDLIDAPLQEAQILFQLFVDLESPRMANTFYFQGEVAWRNGAFAVAKEKYQASLDIWRKLSPVSMQVSGTLYRIGLTEKALGNLKQAQLRVEESIAIESLLQPKSVGMAIAQRELGLLAYQLGDNKEALRWYESSVEVRRQVEGDSLVVASTMADAGGVAFRLKELKKARSHYETALRIAERLRPDTREVSLKLWWIGRIAQDQNDLEEAQRNFEAALHIDRKISEFSKDVAANLTQLGAVAFLRGDMESSKRYREEALAIYVKADPASIDVGRTHNLLGVVAWNRGDLAEAQRHYETALQVCSKVESESSIVAQILFNLGVVAQDVGDQELARRRHEAALAIYQKLGNEPQKVADNLNALGNVAANTKDFERAQILLESALKIREERVPGSAYHAMSLMNLGVLAARRGDRNEYLRLTKEANSLYQNSGKMTAFPNLADLAIKFGDLDEAERLYGAYLAAVRKASIGSSFREAIVLDGLAEVCRIRGDQREFASRLSDRLSLLYVLVSERALHAASEIGKIGVETTKAIRTVGWSETPQSFYAWLPTLNSAGLTLQIRARASERSAEANEEVRTKRSAVQISTKQETDWITNPRPQELDEQSWNDRLIDLRAQRQSAELALATLLKQLDPRLGEELKISQEDVQGSLAEDELLVEYLRVSTWDDKAKQPGPDAYGAYLVPHQGEVRFIRLGEAAQIDDLLKEWHAQIASANDRYSSPEDQKRTEAELQKIGRTLHEKLIKPLGKLPNILLIAPDAELHSLPFAALFDGKKFLVETKAVSIVGSGRDLVEKPLVAETNSAVVLAGPTFDLNVAAIKDADKGLKASENGMRSINAKGEWLPLPAAEQEGQAIAKLLKVEPILGEQATEARLMSVERPVVLHLATHGFFFPPIIDRKERDDLMMTDMTGRGMRAADNPMIRSGLVLSGANNEEELRKEGLADGWATALELSLLDLRGTELVVLSACDTARGDVRGAEGVFGLQRAFRFAGAQSLIMSLFKVPDDSTRLLMESFYTAWKPGSPAGAKLNALRNAQLAMLKNPEKRHPRHWAGFVLMGER